MSLKDTLVDDMKKAMKEKEAGKLRLSVIRMARAAIQNEEIARGHQLSDEEVLDVISREAKKRREAMAEYDRVGRDDMVAALAKELAVLEGYLPQPLSEEEIKAIASQVISEVGPDLGAVMKKTMAAVRGRADGRLVNQIVKAMLS